MYSFGSGVLLGTRTDIANATPVNFGLVQEVTIDETATIKELEAREVAEGCWSIQSRVRDEWPPSSAGEGSVNGVAERGGKLSANGIESYNGRSHSPIADQRARVVILAMLAPIVMAFCSMAYAHRSC